MKKKILALCLVVVLVATAITGVTLAYFTDTDNATNTFTVGNVDIELTEPSWKDEDPNDNFNGQAEVYPGEALPKDPIVTNVGDNPCFVRVKVTGLNSLGDAGMITYETSYETGKLGENWVLHTDGYFYYTKVLCAADDTYNTDLKQATTKLFEQIRIPTGLTNGDGTTTYNVEVNAEAVQAQGAKSSWSAVKNMSVGEIAAWFATCMA